MSVPWLHTCQTHEREQARLSPGNQAVPFEATGNQSQEEAKTLNWMLRLSGLSVWEGRSHPPMLPLYLLCSLLLQLQFKVKGANFSL